MNLNIWKLGEEGRALQKQTLNFTVISFISLSLVNPSWQSQHQYISMNISGRGTSFILIIILIILI